MGCSQIQWLELLLVSDEHTHVSVKSKYCFCTSWFIVCVLVHCLGLTLAHVTGCSTISSDLGGAPFGNVVSYSDGLPEQGKGIPYFYLSTLDPTPVNALKDPRASFSISEYPLGTCGKRDPENPTCAKMTLTGKLELLENDAKEAKFARNVLYKKHPEMKVWPKDHNFRIFKLTTEDIFLINWFGGRKAITVDDYLNFEMNSDAASM